MQPLANINCQRSIVERKLLPRVFEPSKELADLASKLHRFGVTPLKINTLFADADTTLNYAYDIISKLRTFLESHLEDCEIAKKDHHGAKSDIDNVSRRTHGPSSPAPPPQPGSQRSRDQFVSTTPPPNYNGCVFCGSRNHYSALCMRTPKLSERAMSLVRAGRCLKCISRHEPGQCKRRSWCLTCHSYTHHQALCGQGDVIINDVEGPLQEYYDMMSRLSECSYTSYRSRKRARLDREG